MSRILSYKESTDNMFHVEHLKITPILALFTFIRQLLFHVEQIKTSITNNWRNLYTLFHVEHFKRGFVFLK